MDGVECLSVKEVAVTKAYTIGRRGALKDYVDLYFVINENHITLREIIALAEKKYGDVFDVRLFLEQLLYLEDVEDADILFLKEKIGREEIRKLFETKVAKVRL